MSVGKVVNKIIKNLPKIGPRNITYLHIKKIVRQIVSCTYIKLLQYLEVRLGCCGIQVAQNPNKNKVTSFISFL